MERLEVYLVAADNPVGTKQKGLVKYKRAREELTKEQVRAIKLGRKVLKAEMRAKGMKEKSDFELTASNMGLYFDKRKGLGALLWFFHGRGLLALLGATVLLMGVMFLFSAVTQLQGHFTINMSDGLFKEGFVLSETKNYKNASTHLFCTPAENVPCVSISHLPENLDQVDGQHNANYFAYTFYCRNEGQSTVTYKWQMNLNSESKNLSEATWVMIFEDGEMLFYAEPNGETDAEEALPAFDDNTRGFIGKPLEKFNKDPDRQYQVIKDTGAFAYTRVIPISFLSDSLVAEGYQTGVEPMEYHKYTVVIWLEGDDPDCTDDLIGGHVGMDFYFELIEVESEGEDEHGNVQDGHWNDFWDNLKYWED